ncbi:MAG: nucleoside-diphosphate kinase [Candidatus Caenarcaniphilales bacterium]|nr:nucleoside-diphosphate kinase [Candidatus Caenarcaniphilales bacterium]
MGIERTFIAIKPDGTSKKLVGRVIQKFEDLDFDLVGLKLIKVTKELAEKHYGEHKGKPFFDDLVKFITSGPVVAMAWEGESIIEISRKILGSTDPVKAAPGSIRGDFATNIAKNIVHASDSPESAIRELGIFFSEGFVD